MKLNNPDALQCCELIQGLYDLFDTWELSGRPREDVFPDADQFIWGESQSYERRSGPRDRYHWVKEWAPMARLWLRNDGTLFIAIRGTATRREWASNYRFQTRSATLPLIRGSQSLGSVSDGIADIFESMRQDLWDRVEEIGYRRVIVCGHSLGGALATLIYLSLAMRYEIRGLMTGAVFGSPRVGASNFRSVFNDCTDPESFWRYEIPKDIVPKLPFENMGPWSFHHVGMPIIVNVDNGNDRDNHIIASYQKAIESGWVVEP